MKKTYKLIATLVMALILVSGVATTVGAITPGDITATSTGADSEITALGGKILSVITTVGIVLSVLMLSVLGIKYMLGSSEEKAEYKKSLMPYIIGSILVFGASSIASIVYNFMQP